MKISYELKFSTIFTNSIDLFLNLFASWFVIILIYQAPAFDSFVDGRFLHKLKPTKTKYNLLKIIDCNQII